MCNSASHVSSFVPAFVTVNGASVPFTPNPEGGGVWNGEFDTNRPGEFGFTYGYVTLAEDYRVQGYVCHGGTGFRATNEKDFGVVGQRTEVAMAARNQAAGLPSAPPAAHEPTVPAIRLHDDC